MSIDFLDQMGYIINFDKLMHRYLKTLDLSKTSTVEISVFNPCQKINKYGELNTEHLFPITSEVLKTMKSSESETS